MKKKVLCLITMVFVFLISSGAYAMTDNYDYNYGPPRQTPQNEVKHDDKSLDDGWIWLDDNNCVRFMLVKGLKLSSIQRQDDLHMLGKWSEPVGNGKWERKTRDTYAGKWTQAADGTWSFTFDDYTIPVGVAKIDGVLYAFNGYGELQDGYNYWNDQNTGADGLVTCDTQEFKDWLATQYLPDCTSHK